jgi:choice-of-anchor A domain-containing protein
MPSRFNTLPLIQRGLLSLGALFAVSSAHANTFAPLTGQQVLEQFNLVVLGDGRTNSDVEGRIYVQGNFTTGNLVQRQMPVSNYAAVTTGGNLTSANIDNNFNDANGHRPVGVVVGGNITAANVNNGGGAILGNASNSNFNGNTGGTYIGGTVSNVNRNSGVVTSLASDSRLSSAVAASTSTNFAQVMGDLSNQLKAEVANSTATRSGGRTTFTATADASGRAVFDLTSHLLGAGEFDFRLNGARTLIFNSDVAGTINLNANFLGNSALGPLANMAIWNFYNATSVVVGRQFGGSILATGATLTNHNNIEGAVVVKGFDGRGELHLRSFTGQLYPNSDPRQVDEPGTLVLVGAAALAAALTRRRRAGLKPA